MPWTPEPPRTTPPPERAGGKAHDVYAWLRQQIMLSRYAPGQSVAELEVAAQMGCTQGTVREAMLRLQEDGLIVRNGYRGTVVTPVSATEGPLFLKLRAQLETDALRQSMPRLAAGPLDALRALVQQMEAAAEAGDEYALFELDQRFHVTLFQRADLPSLVPVLTRCSLYNHRNKIALDVAPRSLEETAKRHWAIVDALAGGNVAEAERVLRHHIESVVDGDQPAAAPHAAALEALWQRVRAEDAHLPDITQLPPTRRGGSSSRPTSAGTRRCRAAHERASKPSTFPRPGGTIEALRVLPPGGPRAALGTIVYLHGGGWVLGNNHTHLGAMARLAERTACTVIGIDYALAPEQPVPARPERLRWAWRWLRAHADKGAEAVAAGRRLGRRQPGAGDDARPAPCRRAAARRRLAVLRRLRR